MPHRIRRLTTSAAIGAVALLAASCINFHPAFTAPAGTTQAARSVAVTFADVDGDDVSDLYVAVDPDPVAPTPVGELVLMTPCGEACLERVDAVTLPGSPRDLTAADFDNDGVDDLAVGGSWGVSIYYGSVGGVGRAPGLSADDVTHIAGFLAEEVQSVIAVDYDDDGNVDLATSFSLVLETVRNVGDRSFADPIGRVLVHSSTNVIDLAPGDVDGDGDDEIYFVFATGITGFSYTVNVLDIGGGTVTNFETSYPLGTFAVGDLDGDGRDDVAVTRGSLGLPGFPDVTAGVVLLRSTGTGFTGFGPDGAITTEALARYPVGDALLADIDLDGTVDLLVSDPANGRVSWWNGTGTGSFLPRIDRAVGAGARQLALDTTDPDAPGPDLVVTHATATHAAISYLANASKNAP